MMDEESNLECTPAIIPRLEFEEQTDRTTVPFVRFALRSADVSDRTEDCEDVEKGVGDRDLVLKWRFIRTDNVDEAC